MLNDIIILIWLHFFADFLLQTDKIAIEKSDNIKILLLHGCLYTVPFMFFGWQFAVINGVAHFATDIFTSKIASHYYKNNDRHSFFVVIGLDQAIHISTLILTLQFFS